MFVAAGLVHTGDGSVEEERRDGKAMRRETRRKERDGYVASSSNCIIFFSTKEKSNPAVVYGRFRI